MFYPNTPNQELMPSYKCPECDFSGKLGQLMEHLREHPTHWPLQCAVCDRALITQKDFTMHEEFYGHPSSVPHAEKINLQASTKIQDEPAEVEATTPARMRKRTISLPKSRKKTKQPAINMQAPAMGRVNVPRTETTLRQQHSSVNGSEIEHILSGNFLYHHFKAQKIREKTHGTMTADEEKLLNSYDASLAVLVGTLEKGSSCLLTVEKRPTNTSDTDFEKAITVLFPKQSYDHTFILGGRKGKSKLKDGPDKKTIKIPKTPYLHSHFYLAVCITPKENPLRDEKITTTLIRFIHEKMLKRAQKNWTIIGDEFGGFLEYLPDKERQPHQSYPSTMIYYIVPPNSHGDQVPGIKNLQFHGAENLNDVPYVLETVLEHPHCNVFSFYLVNTEVQTNAGAVGRNRYLDIWRTTLPIILHYIEENSETTPTIDIFTERAPGIEEGSEALAHMLPPILRDRDIELGKMEVLSKKPMEHPWLGYPDAVGTAFWSMKSGKNRVLQPYQRKILDFMELIPYRQDSFYNMLPSLLNKKIQPMPFLLTLFDASAQDIRDYVEPLFKQTVETSIAALNEREWQRLLDEIELHAEGPAGQAVSALIHQCTNLNQELAKFKMAKTKFDFCIATLGSANHTNNAEVSRLMIHEIQHLLDGGYQPLSSREMKFKILRKGYGDNRFDFSHIQDVNAYLSNSTGELDDITVRFLGSQAVSRGLRNAEGDVDEALVIEEFIRERTSDLGGLIRRHIYWAELVAMKQEYALANEILNDLPGKVESSKNTMLENSFYLATLLKIRWFADVQTDWDELQPCLKKNLNRSHPSERVAFWAAKTIMKNNEFWISQKVSKSKIQTLLATCTEHLMILAKHPQFKRDIAGVAHVLRYSELQQNGLFSEVNTQEMLEHVLTLSAETTHAWVKQRPLFSNDDSKVVNFTSY